MSVPHRAEARRAPAADRRKHTPAGVSQLEELFHYLEDQSCPVHDSQFATESLGVRVNRVRRDAKVSGDGEFGAVVEHAADDLQLARGEAEAASNF